MALRDAARWKIEKLDTHRHNYVEWISAQQKVVAAASALTFGRPGGVAIYVKLMCILHYSFPDSCTVNIIPW